MKPHQALAFALIQMLACIGCGFTKGYYIAPDGAKVNGYIKYSRCCDSYDAGRESFGIRFKTAVTGAEKKIPYNQVMTLVIDDRTFRVLDSRKIQSLHACGNERILAEPILEGRAQLLSLCTVAYQSTMFSSKKQEVVQYIIQKKNEDTFYCIPHEPKEFIKFSESFFSDCNGIMRSIRSENYTHPIEKPQPGYIREYEFVELNQIITFVKRYNSCAAPRS